VQGSVYRGWALVEQGAVEEGLAQLQQGITAWQATGAEAARPYYLSLLAAAYGKIGRADAGLPLLAEALTAVHQHGEHFYEAELYRLTGELLLAQGGHGPNVSEAEEGFLHALAVARHQQARSLELRAAMRLSRLWQWQGKQAEAHELLVLVYDWFTEGFDTTDLQEAKALLQELSTAP
jgi:predicted ATPase